MGRISRIDELLKEKDKPGNLCKELKLNEDDLLVISTGFEEMAMGVLRRLLISGSSGFNIIVCGSTEDIVDLCQQMRATINIFDFDNKNPSGAGESLVRLIESLDVKGRIIIDVTSMENLLIVQTIAAFSKSERMFSGVSILYSKEIPYKLLPLPKCDYDIVVVPELSSVAMYGNPILLLSACSSYDTDDRRGGKKINELKAISDALEMGREGSWDGVLQDEVLAALTEDIKPNLCGTFSGSNMNYEDTVNTLCDYYNDYNVSKKIVVSPTGSKMQSVGVGIFKAFMDDVAIVYPVLKKRHKVPNDWINIYMYDLSSFNELLEKKKGDK